MQLPDAPHLPGGSRRILSCNAAPLGLDAGGEIDFVVMSISDITDDLAATLRLEAALNRAEDMSRTKSTFLANMSHEIRTPLNGVLGMAEVLADSVSQPAQRRMVDTIRKSGETLLTLLNGILDMSKIEAGKMVPEAVPFVPAALIRQVDAIYGVAAEEKGVAFRSSDQCRLRQAADRRPASADADLEQPVEIHGQSTGGRRQNIRLTVVFHHADFT